MDSVHNMTGVGNTATVTRFLSNGYAIDVREHLLENRIFIIHDLIDLLIRVSAEIFRILVVAFSMDKVVQIDIEQDILVFALLNELGKLIGFPDQVLAVRPFGLPERAQGHGASR